MPELFFFSPWQATQCFRRKPTASGPKSAADAGAAQARANRSRPRRINESGESWAGRRERFR